MSLGEKVRVGEGTHCVFVFLSRNYFLIIFCNALSKCNKFPLFIIHFSSSGQGQLLVASFLSPIAAFERKWPAFWCCVFPRPSCHQGSVFLSEKYSCVCRVFLPPPLVPTFPIHFGPHHISFLRASILFLFSIFEFSALKNGRWRKLWNGGHAGCTEKVCRESFLFLLLTAHLQPREGAAAFEKSLFLRQSCQGHFDWRTDVRIFNILIL